MSDSLGIQFDFSGFPTPQLATLQQTLTPAFEKRLQAIQGAVRRQMPDGATGNLRRSVAYKVENTDQGLVGTIYISDDGAKGSFKPSEYVYYVEHGRAPGTPPPALAGSSLYAWAARKYTSAEFKKTKKKVGKSQARDKAILSMSIRVSKHIGKYGTKAQHPFDKGFNSIAPTIKQLIQEDMINAAQSITGQ